ncbi:MAG: type I-C CRISPR-associated protein Cas7/Csd2 [Clostridiales bacterium]|jgi:CRISPR-associated protein Csd2|nr:type I-C CRISPR-associated protein Cas7/Csd2 [Clostridiales bacterium]
MKIYEDAIKNRYEFVMLYDVENGNPNGDPDSGNMPRIDAETMRGLVTDVCIKRKIRNYIDMVKDKSDGFDIYIRQDEALEAKDDEAIKNLEESKDKKEKSASFRDYMCKKYYDVRTFGAVITGATKDKSLSNVAGQVRGPVQLAFGKSIDPIMQKEISITRVTATTNEKADKASTEMGKKYIVPYALYRQEGFISANLAQRITGFSDSDLEILWEAITNMFEFDRSAARGIMTLRGLYIFKHDNAFGNASAHSLFDMLKVERLPDVSVARKFEDYSVTLDENIPEGVSVSVITL